jgi:ABC-type uncharacterized transport system permease subunit
MWFYPFIVTFVSFFSYEFKMHSIGDMFTWALSLACLGYCGVFLGLIFGTFFRDLVKAIALITPVVSILNLGAGLYANLGSQTNPLVTFITWISPMRYGTEVVFRRAIAGEPMWF